MTSGHSYTDISQATYQTPHPTYHYSKGKPSSSLRVERDGLCAEGNDGGVAEVGSADEVHGCVYRGVVAALCSEPVRRCALTALGFEGCASDQSSYRIRAAAVNLDHLIFVRRPLGETMVSRRK